MRTLAEIKEQLKQLDEVTLLELLGISAEDLVDRFNDVIEEDPDKFNYELNQFFGDEDDHYNWNE